MLSKPSNKQHGSSLTSQSHSHLSNLLLSSQILCKFWLTLHTGTFFCPISAFFSVTLVLCACTNPLLWSLAALNWKHIVSGGTDEARCVPSVSSYTGCVTVTAKILLSLLNVFQCVLLFESIQILHERMRGEMWKILINHLIILQLGHNCCWKTQYIVSQLHAVLTQNNTVP